MNNTKAILPGAVIPTNNSRSDHPERTTQPSDRTPVDEIASLQVGAKRLGSLTTDIFHEGINEASLWGSRLIWIMGATVVGTIVVGGVSFYSLVAVTGELATIAQTHWRLSPLLKSLVFVGLNVLLVFGSLFICLRVSLRRWSRPAEKTKQQDQNEAAVAPQIETQADSRDSNRNNAFQNASQSSRFEEIREEIAGTAGRMGKTFQRLIDPANWFPSRNKVILLASIGVVMWFWTQRGKSKRKKSPAPLSNDRNGSIASPGQGSGIRSLLTLLVWKELLVPACERLITSLARKVRSELTTRRDA